MRLVKQTLESYSRFVNSICLILANVPCLLACVKRIEFIIFIYTHISLHSRWRLRLEDSRGEGRSIGVAWGESTWRSNWRLHKVKVATSHRVDSVEFGIEFPLVCVCQLVFFIVLHKSVGYGSPPVFPLVVEVSGWTYPCVDCVFAYLYAIVLNWLTCCILDHTLIDIVRGELLMMLTLGF